MAKKATADTLREREQLTRRSAFTYNCVAGVDFDTLLWDPSVYLPSGSAQVAFDVPAVAGTYRVLLIGNTADGRLGFYEGHLEVQPDFLAR